MDNSKADSRFPASRSMEDVANFIKKLRFKRKLFGGVDEADVWLKIEALNREYEAVFLAQQIRFEEELARRDGGAAAAMPVESAGQNIPVQTGRVPAAEYGIPVPTGNVKAAGGNIAVPTGMAPAAGGSSAVTTGNMQAAGGSIAVPTGKVPASGDRANNMYGGAPAKRVTYGGARFSGEVPPGYTPEDVIYGTVPQAAGGMAGLDGSSIVGTDSGGLVRGSGIAGAAPRASEPGRI